MASDLENAERDEFAQLLRDGARYNDLEDLQQALDNRADVNATDCQGRTGRDLVPQREVSCSIRQC